MDLVTGGAGFIGSHIAGGLLARGRQVRVLDAIGGGTPRTGAYGPDDVETVVADLRDHDAIRRAVQGVEVIYHHAALASVPQSITEPEACMDINVNGTIALYEAARAAGVRRVVFASSASVYGDGDEAPRREDERPSPRSPYAISKLTGEHLGSVWTDLHGLEVVSLRYFNVYGPGQNPESQYAAAIPKFVDALTHGRTPTVFGDGEQSRDFVYVGDVVAANLLAAEVPEAAGGVFNIASGESRSVNETLAEIARAMGVEVSPHHEPPRAGEVRVSRADISRARSVLGFDPATSFADGLSRAISMATT